MVLKLKSEPWKKNHVHRISLVELKSIKLVCIYFFIAINRYNYIYLYLEDVFYTSV